MQKTFQRVLKLLFRFWIVMILSYCVGFAMGMQDRFQGSLLNFVMYGEYAPYHFVDTEQEFQTLVERLRP